MRSLALTCAACAALAAAPPAPADAQWGTLLKRAEQAESLHVSEETRSRFKGRYDMKPLGTVTVKGKTEPVAIFEIRPPA